MASTPLLGLSLPADGTTNWGTLVNTSVTALIDSSIAGTTTLSSDADVTLTTTAEASNQARQSVLLCTGSRAAVRKIIAPAQSKTYVVINNTTGGFGVTICGVGPTVGITVPNGKTFLVAWNGSDFVTVSVATVNLTTDVTGILPSANGGTGVNNGASTVTLGGSLVTSGANALTLTTTGATNVTLPTTGTLVSLAGAGTLTNKTINGPDNTLTNIANASLTNSAITINGSSVSLGSSTTVTATATNALTIGTGLSGGSYNGSGAVTIALAAGYGDTQNPYASKTANFVLAAPNGSAGAPTFRAIVAADIPTLNQNTTGTAAGLSATLAVSSGGTGQTSYTNGELLIGNSSGNTLTKATLTAGSGVSISNGNGSITISSTGSGGTITSVGATSPVASSGGTTPTISLSANYGDTLNPYASKTANFVLAAPNGSAGVPTFRGLVAADVPALSYVSSIGATSPITSSGGLTPTIGVTSSALTKTDDTNVTLTLGGSPTTSLLAATSITVGWTGQLAVGRGGTGASTFTSGALLKGNGSSALQVASAADIVGQIGSTAVTNATNATKLATTSFTIEESGGKLVFKYGATTLGSMDSSGNFAVIGNVTAYGTP